MISEKLEQAINEQISNELYSEYLYLSMASHFRKNGLNGFENFFLIQAQEEHSHAMKMYNYLHTSGNRVIFNNILIHPTSYGIPKEVFEIAYTHEMEVTNAINNIMNLATVENDHATLAEFQWFVTEQVEEEAMFINIINKLHILKNDGYGILMLDSELAKRIFVPLI